LETKLLNKINNKMRPSTAGVGKKYDPNSARSIWKKY
jgi:hypothetical protein